MYVIVNETMLSIPQPAYSIKCITVSALKHLLFQKGIHKGILSLKKEEKNIKVFYDIILIVRFFHFFNFHHNFSQNRVSFVV